MKQIDKFNADKDAISIAIQKYVENKSILLRRLNNVIYVFIGAAGEQISKNSDQFSVCLSVWQRYVSAFFFLLNVMNDFPSICSTNRDINSVVISARASFTRVTLHGVALFCVSF